MWPHSQSVKGESLKTGFNQRFPNGYTPLDVTDGVSYAQRLAVMPLRRINVVREVLGICE